ncbi:MAG: DUF559 domain-containing protein [Elusimicrobia bacterium]|nr:DUF559 domain-containing protein [Elusimicrobiota bacterium]
MKIIADEPGHPRARQDYRLIELKNVKKLKRPIANKRRMRVTFGFTSLDKLKSAREVKELFDVPPLEETMEQILKDIGITYRREYIVKAASKKHYRLDFALIPRDKHPAAFSRQVKPVGIECDGNKAHNRPEQKLKDRQKDSDLQALGWKILRFCEQEILKKPGLCRKKIETMLK